MKFTKEEAYKELVAKLTEKGEKLNLSERTLKRQLETLIKYVANDEMELADFIKEVLPDVKELDGQYRKDNSDFIKEWEKNHPTTTEPKPKTEPKPNEGQDTEMAKLIKEMAELKAEINANKLANTIKQKKSELKKALKEKGVDDDEWVDLMLQKVSITEEFDIEAETEYYLKLYNKSNPIPQGTATPHSTTGGGGSSSQMDESIAQASANMKRKREEEEKLLN